MHLFLLLFGSFDFYHVLFGSFEFLTVLIGSLAFFLAFVRFICFLGSYNRFICLLVHSNRLIWQEMGFQMSFGLVAYDLVSSWMKEHWSNSRKVPNHIPTQLESITCLWNISILLLESYHRAQTKKILKNIVYDWLCIKDFF